MFLCPKHREDVIVSAASYWLGDSNKILQSLDVDGVLGARWTAGVESTCNKVAHRLIWKATAGKEWAGWIWHTCRNQGPERNSLSSAGSNCSPAVQAGH